MEDKDERSGRGKRENIKLEQEKYLMIISFVILSVH
jgi:hypothetical protein